ncbi:MAG: hypothetical protein K2N35_00420 [Muribaculaceae bacterium]|nr:hypothetical protein [Muribaculaceae bacterium]
MKHLTSTAVLCVASILGASAQTIIVTDKDGVAHRFNADYVKEITFEPAQSQGDIVNLNIASVAVNPYNLKNIEVTLTSENGDVVDLDLYQPSTMWLSAGNYVVDDSNGDFTIDPGYSKITIGGEQKALKSGSLEIKLDGEVYTFNVDLVVGDDINLKGIYTGKLSTFGPMANYDLTGVAYVEVNDPKPNGFYYRFNDANWKIEMRIDLFSEGNAPKPGTYTFSESTDNGCAGSYVNLYAPYNDASSFKEGTVTVEESGDNTIITVNGVLENGLPMTASFSGELPARPAIDQDINLNIASVKINPYGLKNIEVTFESENGDIVDLDLYQPSTMWLSAGNYVVDGSNTDFTIDPGYSKITIGGEQKVLKSGSLEIKLDGEVYTFNVDLVVDDDISLKGTYTGELSNFGPIANFDLTGVAYVEVNEPEPNGFYYRFNDANWKIEMRIDLFSEGNAPKPGTYTFSKSTDNGCAGSYVNLYSPYNDASSFQEGTVTVEESGDITIIKVNGVLENGLPMTASFSGELPARPAAE